MTTMTSTSDTAGPYVDADAPLPMPEKVKRTKREPMTAAQVQEHIATLDALREAADLLEDAEGVVEEQKEALARAIAQLQGAKRTYAEQAKKVSDFSRALPTARAKA